MNFWRRNVWLVFLALGAAGSATVWLFLPHKSEIDSPWQVVFKLSVFLLVVLAISFFPNHLRRGYLLAIVPFLGFAGYLVPRISYYGFTGVVPTNSYAQAGNFYTLLYLLTYPALVLTTTSAFRLGGGRPGQCVKIALSGVIILFSGFLDLLWYLVNPVPIPQTMQYAHHIAVVLGHYASWRETIVFALCHIPLLAGLLALPLDRWFDRWFSPAAGVSGSTPRPGDVTPLHYEEVRS